jgi:hypothetical protein
MKRTLFACIIALFTAVPAFAWHCPTGQHWVQVAPGTPGVTVVEGIPFACFPDNPTPSPAPKPTDPTSTSSSTSASSSQATASASQGQKQGQGQSQTANGGQATANNSNANNGNNLSTAYSSEYNQVRQAPMAYAPEVFSTAACRAGASAGISAPIGGISLGGSKRDKDCERSVLANQFFSRGNYVAGCKLLMHVSVVKEALTFDECVITVQPKPVFEAPVVPIVPSITVNVPAPIVTPILQVDKQAVTEKPQTVTVVAPKPKIKHAAPKPCPAPIVAKPVCKPTAQLCPIVFRNGVKIIMERA